MNRRLPPLNGLRAFEAAARHLSFKKAAEELHVTPAAISQQVRALEEHCGVELFRRLTRALKLTEAGQAALPQLREGFDRLAEGAEAMRAAGRTGILTVDPLAHELWQDEASVTVAVPDQRKGERLVLVTTASDVGRGASIRQARSKGVSEPHAPAEIVMVDALPVLGSGKPDYPAIRALAESAMGRSTSRAS